MKKALLALALAATAIIGAACGAQGGTSGAAAEPLPDIASLSDEFDDPATLDDWTELSTVEGHKNWVDQLSIGEKHPGELFLSPYASGWFEDDRGVFLFKEVTGDFDVTFRLLTTGKETDVPQKSYSLAGLMAREPRDITMDTWTPGKENWLFITNGYGSYGQYIKQIETKTTIDSKSDLRLTQVRDGWIELRIIRLGDNFFTLYKPEGSTWTRGRTFPRPDLPDTLQVGIAAYSNGAYFGSDIDSKTFNTIPENGPADLLVRGDYIRFARPNVPAELVKQIQDGSLSDSALIEFLNQP
ncbi:hypothetical protein [Paenibacillus sp.]|uniref:hypothetical protein n=1 Tax=Paenibacillus sp. TaxID=58172 RepID=UPI002D272CEB|nr:hypothetical protein [Paenibacillus sp.]HZG57758.1 hypothetical protein [Paenibacillus sp.]